MIYLDHHAATPLSEPVVDAMREAARFGWANPSSVHAAGRRARRLLEESRAAVAAAIGAQPADVVLSGGGTEAVNLGVFGLAKTARRMFSSDLEHPSVRRTVEPLARADRPLTILPLRPGAGLTEVEADVEGALVTLQWVNHETGTITDVPRLVPELAERGALVFVDACQALGKVAVDVTALGAHAVAFAGAKIGAPAGAGALWVRRDVDLAPLLGGGAQERGRRPGTPDVVSMVGFGAACAVIDERLATMARLGAARDRLEIALSGRGAVINGAATTRVPTVTNVSLRGHRGDTLVAALDVEGLCVSSGAACSSGLAEPSPVVAALHPDASWRASSALRFSLGPQTRDDDIDGALAIVDRVLSRGPGTSEPAE